MDLGLPSKAALVTGGSKGIGAATATLLSRRGAPVAIRGRTEAQLHDTAPVDCS